MVVLFKYILFESGESMKTVRIYPKATITEKEEKRIRKGHPWVYKDEIVNIDKNYENGDLVDVVSTKGKYLATGFINDNSKIEIRIISRNINDTFDVSFWRRRVEYAWNYRKSVMSEDLNNVRIIFGEADFFPGLTVDKFNDCLVVQTLSLGIEKRKDIIFPLILETLSKDGIKIRGIFERNDVKIRELEGLEENVGWYVLNSEDESVTTTIVENGLKYIVDFQNGQKTGFFLDQKYNRRAVREIAKDKCVLDCCTHTGSFAMNAILGGAKKVVAVDISKQALDIARKNLEENNLEEKVELKQADVFDLLKELDDKNDHSFDMIILDPPAFTKSKDTVKSAYRGYKEINYRAMKILPRGGYLVTASCSHFMKDKLFVQMLEEAAMDANVMLREIEVRKQAKDHPILWNADETSYLKLYIFQVV